MCSFSQPSTSMAELSSTSQGNRPSRSRSRPSMPTHDLLDKLARKCEYMTLFDEINTVGASFLGCTTNSGLPTGQPSSDLNIAATSLEVDGGSSIQQTAARISSIVEKAEKLFEMVKDTGEMYLDAKVMHSTSTALEISTNNIDVGEGQFKLHPFADQFKMKAVSAGAEAPWEALVSLARPVVSNSIPRWSPLLGSFEFEAVASPSTEKKVRQIRSRDVATEKKEPEKGNQLDKSEKRAEEIVQMIFSKLRKYYRQSKQEPINYFRFVINPTSFAATVENIFYVSFLVNDGHVKLEIEDDELFISPNVTGKENSNPQTQQQQSREKKQNIVSIDMKMWRELSHGLQLKEAMI